MKTKFSIILIFLLSFLLYFWGAFKQEIIVNTEMTRSDQSAYMLYAKELHTNFDLTSGDRNRMPIYPAIMSFLYKNDMADQDFFEAGKIASIFLGAVVILVFFLLIKKHANFLDSVTAMLVVMFTVIAFKAPFFQADVLYYGVNFVFFYLSISLLKKPTITKSILSGVIAGLCYLTKASILPSIILLIFFFILQAFLSFNLEQQKSNSQNINYSFANHFFTYIKYSTLIILFFFLVIFSYINKSKLIFGQYFYNVNTTFYIWYDSWEQATNGTKAFGDRIGWPTMPKDQIPTLKKYYNEHSTKKIINRFTLGYKKTFINMANSYGYHKFIFAYFSLFVILFIQNNSFFHLFKFFKEKTAIFLYTIAYFLCHLTLYAWYTPIADGNRFVLTLLLPLMFIFINCSTYSNNNKMSFNLFGEKINSQFISFFILFSLGNYLFFDYAILIMKYYGGK